MKKLIIVTMVSFFLSGCYTTNYNQNYSQSYSQSQPVGVLGGALGIVTGTVALAFGTVNTILFGTPNPPSPPPAQYVPVYDPYAGAQYYPTYGAPAASISIGVSNYNDEHYGNHGHGNHGHGNHGYGKHGYKRGHH